jgi:methyl-accepting chemotaxis protein
MKNKVSITGALIFMVAFIVVMTLLGIGGTFMVASAFKEAINEGADATTLMRAHGDADMMHEGLRGDAYAALLHGGRGDMSRREEINREFADHKKTWLADNATIRATAKSANIEKAFQAAEPRVVAYIAQTEKLIALAYTDNRAALDQMVELNKSFDELEKLLAAMSDQIEKRNHDVTTAAAARASAAATTTTIVGAGLILLILAVSLWAFRTVGQQVKLILGASKDLASGDADLTRRLPAMTGELGRLGNAMNNFVEKLHDMVTEVATKSTSIATASAQISIGSTDLSSRTEQQAATLEETASSMEEFTTSIRQTAENTKSASQSARLAIVNAETGRNIVANAGQRMTDIHTSAQRITEITNIIDSLALQTNILALNAAVEAARAGEQGRGFAVVAGEVRALAQRSAASAKDIKSLIDETAASIEAGTQLVRNAELAMDKIVHSNQAVLQTVTDISNAANEQAIGVDQVNRAIVQLEGVTQQNAALVEESSAASESMREQAEHLRILVSQFRLNANAERKASLSSAKQARAGQNAAPVLRNVARRARLPRAANARNSPNYASVKSEEWDEF